MHAGYITIFCHDFDAFEKEFYGISQETLASYLPQ